MEKCKDCLHFERCVDWCEDFGVQLKGTGCSFFKNKNNFVEVSDKMIICTKDKWLLLNMESERLGESIKTCMDCLKKMQ